MARDIHKTTLQELQAQRVEDEQQSLVYSDPKVKRTGVVSLKL